MKIMAVVNATPDSFYSGSRIGDLESGVQRALELERQGADILDIGGESTRPGSQYVSLQDEIERVLPLIQAIRKESNIALSLDTRKAQVAAMALDAGVNMINDISALRDDPEMAKLVAQRNVPVVLMHRKGDPEHMQTNPNYEDTWLEVLDFFRQRIHWALSQGISQENIILDPGIGFGKRLQDNLTLIANLGRLKDLGYSVLMGLSRKSFISALDPSEPTQRLGGSLAGALISLEQGADFIRVHDVLETRQAIKVHQALREAQNG